MSPEIAFLPFYAIRFFRAGMDRATQNSRHAAAIAEFDMPSASRPNAIRLPCRRSTLPLSGQRNRLDSS
jgi:hypothetical protein